MEAEVKIYCEGEEVATREFDDRELAEEFFDTYPLDDMADEAVLYGYDCFGDWEEIDRRHACPSED